LWSEASVVLSFRGVFFEERGKQGTTIESHFETEWTESALLTLFPGVEYATKDEAQLWAAASYKEGCTRGNAGIRCMHSAVIEKDCGDIGELDVACAHLDRLGLAYVVYTTWSHRDPAKRPDTREDDGPLNRHGPYDCFRIVLPYSREVTRDEHAAIIPGLIGVELPEDPASYAAEVAGRSVVLPSGNYRQLKARGWDPVCNRATQSWFVPLTRAGFAEHAVLEVRQGRALDVDAVLKRPATPRVTSYRERPYRTPTPDAEGAMRRLSSALERAGVGALSRPGFAGWARTVCPNCQSSSPSLTVRANGDGVEMKCWGHCDRRDILAALDFEDRLITPPSFVREAIEIQLGRQLPAEAPIGVEEAGPIMAQYLREALDAREPTVLVFPAGTGKSFQAAHVMSERAALGKRIVYTTLEHKVAHETRAKLKPGVRSVHVHSPLIQVGDEPICQRAAELKERVLEYGESLLGRVCPRCPHRLSCEALKAAKQRAADIELAQVVFVSHAGINQVFGLDANGVPKGADFELIVDEMPSVYDELEIDARGMQTVAGFHFRSLPSLLQIAVRDLAESWLAGREPGVLRWTPTGEVVATTREVMLDVRRIRLRDDAKPTTEEREAIDLADAMVRLWVAKEEGRGVVGTPARGVWAMLPDSCHTALVEHRGVLLSATPLLPALPGFAVRQVDVADSCRVKRIMVPRAGRGSKALTTSEYDDDTGRRFVGDGIPWPTVDAAVERGVREAMLYGPGARVLFVSFKMITDALRRRGVPETVELAHFGAVRGKNDWQEGAAKECAVVYLFGTPRFALDGMLKELGLNGTDHTDAWVDCAAGELTQAEGRLRLPRRKSPCTVFCEGDVTPSTWSTETITEYDEAADPKTASALFEGLCRYRPVAELARRLGRPEAARWPYAGTPHDALEQVRALRDELFERPMALLKLSPGRLRASLNEVDEGVGEE
jgi:hypothetical protein